MKNKFENRIWLSVEIDRISLWLYNANKVLSVIAIGLIVFASVTGASHKDTSAYSMLLAIPVIAINIFAWKLIRNVCVAVALLLSDSCNKECINDSEENKE